MLNTVIAGGDPTYVISSNPSDSLVIRILLGDSLLPWDSKRISSLIEGSEPSALHGSVSSAAGGVGREVSLAKNASFASLIKGILM